MTISPYEEAALCRESSRLKDEALRRLDGETVAIGFTPNRWKARRRKAATESVAPAQAMAAPHHPTPGRDDGPPTSR